MDKKSYVETRLEKRLIESDFEKEWSESEVLYNKEREEASRKLLEATKNLPIKKYGTKEELEKWLEEEW